MKRKLNKNQFVKRNELVSDEKVLNRSSVGYSGNSDVDVNVAVDTEPLAYAMLCSLLATNQMTRSEFDHAVQELEDFKKKD